ncbi:MAG TPA: alpha-E domain-containing protein [Nitrospiraceae bacterium]|nr:alpha-E domain-containing protein [Nitrospiraceae bacterium]
MASSIYWLNRYIERAENYARFIEVNLNLTLDLPGGTAEQWEPLVATTGDHESFTSRYGKATKETVIHFLLADAANANSILSCLAAARENARSVREIISTDMWEQVNRFHLMVRDAVSHGLSSRNLHAFLAEVKAASHLFLGITDATMSHGEGWHFARLGRLLERADKTSRILDVKYFMLLPTVAEVGTPFDIIQWSALLKSASALEMYYRRFGRISPNGVTAFLILDATFPRAIRYCLIKSEDSLHAISGSEHGAYQNQAEKRLGRLRAELDFADLEECIADGLHEFVDRFQAQLNHVGEAIFDTFFAPRPIHSTITGAEAQ